MIVVTTSSPPRTKHRERLSLPYNWARSDDKGSSSSLYGKGSDDTQKRPKNQGER
jgi:hypothetical protein